MWEEHCGRARRSPHPKATTKLFKDIRRKFFPGCLDLQGVTNNKQFLNISTGLAYCPIIATRQWQ